MITTHTWKRKIRKEILSQIIGKRHLLVGKSFALVCSFVAYLLLSKISIAEHSQRLDQDKEQKGEITEKKNLSFVAIIVCLFQDWKLYYGVQKSKYWMSAAIALTLWIFGVQSRWSKEWFCKQNTNWLIAKYNNRMKQDPINMILINILILIIILSAWRKEGEDILLRRTMAAHAGRTPPSLTHSQA